MNRIVKKISLLLALISAVFTVINSANAAIISTITTQTANLVFAAPSTASITLTPKSDLTAGSFKAGDVVATAQVTASAGKIAYRWTSGTGTISSSTANLNDVISITGENNKSDIISLRMLPSNNTPVVTSGASNGNWIIPSSNISQIPLNIVINKDSTVAADTYVISIDAAVWGS